MSTFPSDYPTATATTTNTYPAGATQAKHHKSFIESLCTGFSEPKQQNHGIKLRYIINVFKAMTAIYILSLMNHYKNFSLGSFLYLALHGIYGLIWIVKDLAFPDRNFDKRVGFFSAMVHFCMMTGYWVLPWLQISGHGINKPTSERVMSCIMLFAMGITVMIASDAQKAYTLEHRPGLISTGMFKYTRNPSYLGQLMIYASFALATGSVISWGVLATIWITFFLPRMVAKDVSLRNQAGAKEYFHQSSILLPKFFFKNTFLHYLSWAAIFGTIFFIGGMISFTHFLKHPLKSLFH